MSYIEKAKEYTQALLEHLDESGLGHHLATHVMTHLTSLETQLSQAPTQGAPDRVAALERIASEVRALLPQWDEDEEPVYPKALADALAHLDAIGDLATLEAPTQGAPDLEALAALAHEQWSGWMRWIFGKCVTNLEPGCMIIPRWAVDRWQRQMNTPYAQLSEEEKQSDRAEARAVLDLVAALGGKK